MMNTLILQFLTTVKSRLERAWLVRAFSFSLLAVALVLSAWSLWWVAQGYAVPKSGYLVAAAILPIAVALSWFMGRVSLRQAALKADEHFRLKDAVSSHLGFSQAGSKGQFIALQAEATAARVSSLSAASIPITWPRRLLGLAGVLLLACLVMSFRQPSHAVLEKLALEEDTSLKTEEINKGIEEELEKLIKSASDEEQELIKTDQWRKWVMELETTKDPKEAMRQYAQLEKRMAEAAQKMGQRDVEQLLTKAAQELQQAAELKPISKSLTAENYRKAAEQLRQMKLKADVSKPQESQKELAKLKSAAQRMASAARNFRQRSGSSGQSREGQKTDLAQQMLDLEQAVQQLQHAQLQPNPNQSQCQNAQNLANQALDKLCQSMCQAAAKKECQKKLMSLCQTLGQCQSSIGDKQCQSPFAKPGGKNAGSNTVASRRDANDPTVHSGNQEQLQGIKGSGPSDTTTESADSGTGRSTQIAKVQDKIWQQQAESFIQRDDVPSEVKAGVKEYFKGIQQVTNEP